MLAAQRDWIEATRLRQVPRLGLTAGSVAEPAARRAARELLTSLAQAGAQEVGVGYTRIRVGAQRTLWGSCSPTGTLSFNWRLVLAPAAVADYVVIHELCHLRVPDHSPGFWALLERHRPGWRAQRSWLREFGAELLAFRPAG